MPTPGPNTPTKSLETGPRSLPMSASPGDDASKVHLTADEVRAQLQARERDIQYRLDALKHEALAVIDDVNIDGRPLSDYIRQRPLEIVGGTLGGGLLLGLLWGLRKRAKRRPEADQLDVVRARLDMAIEEAALRVAGGADTETALMKAMPVVPAMYAKRNTKTEQASSSTREAIDVAVKTAIGFGVKAAMDMAIRRYTDADGTLDALSD
ncbi:hypothetical protein [Rubrivirga sp. IMCC45206]|uniref:hypothetical protein n=1 Tax=Rubrivirga sp. IMCC45206 TaxID=3391614 RepID=UPI00398FFBDA